MIRSTNAPTYSIQELPSVLSASDCGLLQREVNIFSPDVPADRRLRPRVAFDLRLMVTDQKVRSEALTKTKRFYGPRKF